MLLAAISVPRVHIRHNRSIAIRTIVARIPGKFLSGLKLVMVEARGVGSLQNISTQPRYYFRCGAIGGKVDINVQARGRI